MRYLYLTLALSIAILSASAQDKKEEKSKEEKKSEVKQDKTDVLRAQSSPASALLGIAISDIEKPSDISDFMVSLQSASSSYSKLPSNYAVDLAPFYLFRKNGADFSTTGKNGLLSTKFKDYFRQSFVLSFALRNPDSAFNNFKPTSTYGAIGIKFALVRPKYTDKAKATLSFIREKQEKLVGLYEEKQSRLQSESKNFQKLELRQKIIKDSISNLKGFSSNEKSMIFVKMQSDGHSEYAKNNLSMEIILDSIDKVIKTDIDKEGTVDNPSLSAKIEELAKSFDGNRQGLSIDIAGGMSTEFRQKRFDNSKVFNSGVWATGGYNWKDGSSILLLARYLYNPDEIFALNNITNTIGDISTFDAGLKYALLKGKFGASGEAIYRSILSSSTVKPSWRFAINAEYALNTNQKLNFSFGRNFDGTTTKDNNLIAALTVIFGLGTAR